MIAGVLGGSNYNVLGPAGALVNVLSSLVAHHGI
jgi:MFS superfamily sulfate permease-like transporter